MAEIAAAKRCLLSNVGVAVTPVGRFVIMPLFAFANAGLPLSLGDLGSRVTVAGVCPDSLSANPLAF